MGQQTGFEWTDEPRFAYPVLERFLRDIFVAAGFTSDDAQLAAEGVLIADVRGVETHGVQRMGFYLDGIRLGNVDPGAVLSVDREHASTIAFHANGGMGQIMAARAMERTIAKAEETGICLATMRNSGHYGIAGRYALMAARRGMGGISMTNTSALVVPTHARDRALGTNPIAFAVPTNSEPLCLDMATSTVAIGKVEVAKRLGIPIPIGWGVDIDGVPTTDPFQVNGLLPIGGMRETSGHKGYGLGLMVEVFCAQLASNAWSLDLHRLHADGDAGAFGQMFMAWRIDAFRDLQDFKDAMDDMLQVLRGMETVIDGETVLAPGDPELVATERNLREGIPIRHNVLTELQSLAAGLGVEPLQV